MSHWYRSPTRVSTLAGFLRETQRGFVIDRSIVAEAGKEFAGQVIDFKTFDFARNLSQREIAKTCEQSQSILVTCDRTYEAILRDEASTSWGLLLLPIEEKAQAEAIWRLWSQELRFTILKRQKLTPRALNDMKLLIDLQSTPTSVRIFGNKSELDEQVYSLSHQAH